MMLEELKKEISGCKDCALYATRTNLVFGVGSENAELMFVGEAPGFHEDKLGEPFVGAAGKLLDELLAQIGLNRSQIYIANVLKCRPPNNRNPLPEEIEVCKAKLFKQIEIIGPGIVSTLGNFATKLILESNVGISKIHGKPHRLEKFTVLPAYHPAAALYTPATKKALEQDFQIIKGLLANGVKKEKREYQPEIEQMSLW